METNMIIAAVLGLGAALALMYIVLRKYTYPAVEQPFFSDPSFFGLFTVGLITGTGIFVGYSFFYGDWGWVVTAIAFALVFELAKLVVLNLKRFHGKSDTVFYGFGLGIGVGGAFAFGFAFYASSIENMPLASWMLFAVITVQTVLVHSATGMTIGEGIARRRPFEFLLQALIISFAYQLLVSQMFVQYSEPMIYVFLALSFLLALGYFYHIVYVKLPKVIRDVLKAEGKSRKDIPL
jgi:succinate dehydrogenase hydrophobic anchor subunit